MAGRKAKKQRIERQKNAELEPRTSKDYLSTLPLELLAEVLSTTATNNVLSLARCSRYFCHTLVNPTSAFIWRRARASCTPLPIPDPTPNFTEAAYAAFIFDSGKCEVCGAVTDKLYESFALKLRVCKSHGCIRRWYRHHSFSNELAFLVQGYEEIRKWLPPSESEITQGSCFRRRDWEEAQNEYKIFLAEENGLAAYQCLHAVAAARLPRVMKLATELRVWRVQRETYYVKNKEKIEHKTSEIAKREGWVYKDLLNAPSYLAVYLNKKIVMEPITDQDFLPIRSIVENEIKCIHEHRERSAEEAIVRKKRDAVALHYQQMKSKNNLGLVLPTLPVFRTQPMIKVLQDRKSGKDIDVARELSSTSIVQKVLYDELLNWTMQAKEQLADILGYPKYKHISENKLHPVDRLTARFLCIKCNRISEKYAKEQCLDFRGVCEHRCLNLTKKQKTREVWKADQFAQDTKAITAVREVLNLVGLKEEDKAAQNALLTYGSQFLCTSCVAPIAMDFSGVIGHCKRHDVMGIRLLTDEEALDIMTHSMEHGLCAEMLGRQKSAPRKRALKIYGCRHCHQALTWKASSGSGRVKKSDWLMSTGTSGQSTQVDKAPSKSAEPVDKLMSFDGLRSHLKTKHGVIDIRDEDVYRIQETPKTAGEEDNGSGME